MNEKSMQTFFGNYLKNNLPVESEAYELKITSGNILPFNAIKDHQIKALLDVEGKGLYHRLTDQPWIENRPYTYTLKKPFDCFCLVKVKGYLILWFYKPRMPKKFFKMRINDFLKLRRITNRKSMTMEMALSVSSILTIN